MKSNALTVSVYLLSLAVFLGGCQTMPSVEGKGSGADVASGDIRSWLICGEFPNPPAEGGDVDDPDTRRTGLDVDYLTEHGGETKIRPVEGMTHLRPDRTEAKWVRYESESNLAELQKLFPGRPDLTNVVAYAYSTVIADTAGEAYLDVASDDGVSVWINGKLVHRKQVTRKVWDGADRVKVVLRKGANRLLIKVEQFKWDWLLSAKVISYSLINEMAEKAALEKDLKSFQSCALRPRRARDYMFAPGKFPEIVWEDPETVERVAGKCPLSVRWFNNALDEVDKPEEPGRYMAYVEGKSEGGLKVRRALTFYCRPDDWHPWRQRPRTILEYPEGSPIDESVWKEHEDLIGERAAGQFVEYLQTDQYGAILLSYLHETKPRGRKPIKIESPKIVNNDRHLALKLKLLAEEGMGRRQGLKPPTKLKTPATVLRKGTSAEAGMSPGTAEKITEVCKEWVVDTGKPFVTLVARNGIIFVHEAFNKEGDGVEKDSQLYMASLTKTMSGLLFGQFVDQGLIDLDDPVGRYLPDYPLEGEDAVTFRHCFTHTIGLKGHYMWGGVHNPWYDNVLLAGLRYVTPGETKRYNGMGYDLAGKAMEVVGRKSIIRLFHENFFEPLGIQDTEIDNMACATSSTAMDMAVMGQLLLNRGSYGDKRLFGPKTFEKMLPQMLSKYYPEIDLEIGTGLIWLRTDDPRAGKGGVPEDKTLLSKNTIGHRAASGAVLRVDLDNDIVLVQMRQTGKDEGEHFVELLQVIDDGIIDKKP